ncbi:MAG: FHA domain-containing protein [Candidatus Lindowbacteria bacterium]|nr:FHA domain-containing protein [Candidatus Lindowbacteria bacterium]
MYKFIIREKGKELREVLLDKPRLFVGRDASNEITLEDDSVSSRHFSIELRRDKVVLQDEDSLNGTFLGNSRERIKAVELKHGDIIRVGHTLMKFVKVVETPRPAEEYVRRQPEQRRRTIIANDIQFMERELESVVARIDAMRKRDSSSLAAEISQLQDPFAHARNKLSLVGKSYDRLSALYEASKYIISGFAEGRSDRRPESGGQAQDRRRRVK